jgi:glycosyltransferase involved in cell wall biosynthesis
MRIALDYQAFVLQSYGGISRYFTRLAQGMLYMEQQVGIFAPLHRNGYLSALPKEVIHGKYIDRYPARTARFFGAYNQIGSRFQMARWKPDLVHETYYSKMATAPRRCPGVVTVYDMIHELFPNDFPLKDKAVNFKRIAVERADHVICISENTKMDLMRLYGTSANKLSVVHLGFDQFLSTTGSTRFVTPSGRPFILYVGQRGGYKNFMGFLRAVASSSRLLSDFDIIAFGGGLFSSGELSEISALGFSEDQVIQKSGTDDLLGSLYNSARSFVYPSLYEGFGIPPLEAMAHQCPVISSKSSSMPEVIGLAGEYFDPADRDDMCRAIEDVVYSDIRINLLQQSGNERLTSFSWDKCSRETLDIYRTLV